MPDQLKQIIAFCSKRYNANIDTRPGLAKTHMQIINHANDLRLSSADPERDLLDFLSKPQTDLDLARACKEVLEHIGAEPGQVTELVDD